MIIRYVNRMAILECKQEPMNFSANGPKRRFALNCYMEMKAFLRLAAGRGLLGPLHRKRIMKRSFLHE